MKKTNTLIAHKGILSAILMVIITIGMNSCSKKKDVTPTTPVVVSPIKLGAYKIIRDQGSDNGDTNYYDRTISDCEAGDRYTFTATDLTISGPCTTTFVLKWKYDTTTDILTITGNQGGTVKVESLTATGFIWNAIATGYTNQRLTLQLVPGS